MNLKKQLAVTLLLAGSVSAAHATTYNVDAVFGDGGVQGETTFTGSFDWDGANVTNFSGNLSEAMWEWNDTAGQFSRMNMMTSQMQLASSISGDHDYNSGGYSQGDAPLLSLTNMLDNSEIYGASAGTGLHAVTAFLHNSTDVLEGTQTGSGVYNGGYDLSEGSTYFGKDTFGNQTRNWNAFFTLAFDVNDPTNTALAVNSMEYADCNALGMMGAACMTGHVAGGTMNGVPSTLSISEVSAVPVPAAAWLFGGALMSLFGANRRKTVMPA